MTPLSKLVRYRLLGENPEHQHGQGGIWKARDLLNDEDVALKEIRADLRDDPAAIESFRKEAAAGARLSKESPNIVKIVDYGQIEGTLYFAMEWIVGGNLSSRCGHMSLQEAKSTIRQILGAVSVAHRHSIVHSDIAPANVLYDKNTDRYKLADFGYLKVLDSSLLSRGIGSMLIGGRAYFLPPEHLFSPESINASTDIYALALTMLALVSGTTLKANDHGRLIVPGVIQIRHEGRSAPDQLRQLLSRFVEGRREDDSVEEFRSYLDRIP